MSTQATATCTDCGWTGGPYRSPRQAQYALTRHSCARHQLDLDRAARVATRKAASGPTRECHCPIANHTHGTHAAYVIDKCRCRKCRDAATTYENRRAKDRAYGRHAYVDATPTRTHIETLQAQGMGWKRIARAAGIEPSVVWKILYGDPSRSMPPTVRVRPTTEAKILTVTLDLAPGARVEGIGTSRRLQALAAMGWSQAKLASRLGMLTSNLAKIIHGDRGVTHATAQAVTVLYDELWNQPPPAATKWDKIARANALNAARANGWTGPLSWDDDTIDDPAASPDTGTPDHSPGGKRIHVDDLEHLLDTAAPYTWDGITARLGTTRNAIEQACKQADRLDLTRRISANTRGTAA